MTVYDAEDKPDPAQLKKAVWGFRAAEPRVACLQAKLGYYNPRQNLLTRWFTLEYDAWFNIFLPGLHRIGAPIPLGGTSNHFRRAPLEPASGWDPVQRHRGRGPRPALRPARAHDGDARVDDRRGGQQPGRQLAAPALPLEQGLHADGARPHAASAAGCCASSGRSPPSCSCSRSAAPSLTALLAPIFWVMLGIWTLRTAGVGRRALPRSRSSTRPRSAWWPATSLLVFLSLSRR